MIVIKNGLTLLGSATKHKNNFDAHNQKVKFIETGHCHLVRHKLAVLLASASS